MSELSVGDALYAESSDSAYWVTAITASQVSLVGVETAPCTWQRETLNASLEANRWIRQSRTPADSTDA